MMLVSTVSRLRVVTIFGQVVSLLTCLLSGLLLCPKPAFAQETIPGWHPNLEEARRQAEATGKPLFITFRCVR